MPKHSYVCLSDFKNLSLQILGKEMKRYSLNWINQDINITIIKYAISILKYCLEKTEEPEIKLPTSTGSLKKQESSRKTSTSALLTMPRPLTVWITINCGKFFKRWEYQTT